MSPAQGILMRMFSRLRGLLEGPFSARTWRQK
jgi:hypothetical protein